MGTAVVLPALVVGTSSTLLLELGIGMTVTIEGSVLDEDGEEFPGQ